MFCMGFFYIRDCFIDIRFFCALKKFSRIICGRELSGL